MDTDGIGDARGTAGAPVPRPAGPPAPPPPAHAPGATHDPGALREQAPSHTPVADWLDTPRPTVRPGIWRLGYRPPKPGRGEGDRLAPVTLAGLLIPLIGALILWSLWRHGRVPFQGPLLRLMTPDDWWYGGTVASPRVWQGVQATVVYHGLFFAALVYGVARLGSWPEIAHHYLDRRPQPQRALLAALAGLAALSLVFPSAFPLVGWDPLPVVNPLLALTALVSGGYDLFASALFVDGLYAVVTVLVLWPFARLGGWWPYAKELIATRRGAATPAAPTTAPVPRSQWPDLRNAGQHQAAELLAAEVAGGRMNDVDCARVSRAWATAQRGGEARAFGEVVLREGAAAWTHPSGARDLPRRAAQHDLLDGQVRIGRWVATERAPRAYHDAGAALGPDALATSLLAVGPSGAGKTRGLIEPVTESLALQALTGRSAVVAVSAVGARLASDDSFDVIVRIGDPASGYDLDPYAESTDPDEAGAILAEALVGDLDASGGQSAATALAQLLGPYRAAYGRFPTLPVLRELLAGEPTALAGLQQALAGPEHLLMRRELDTRVRQMSSPADIGRALADRLALLDRPAFGDFFGGGAARPFSLRAVAHHPMRVRIDPPERGHEEAARLITRLVLAQFLTVVRDDGRSHFAGLVLDDATGTVTPESVRRIQRLRSQNAGVVLALRSIGDVPEALHGPLYGAVGCRMAFAGVTTWDGSRFAQAWGTEWVETKDVAKHTVFADQPMTRAIHALRKRITGKAVTTDAITVRQVERERWSASELAQGIPPGHAVLSLASVGGEHSPPLLVDLGS
ncbi:ATP/GTP-binding protein [Streptomyces triticagri]|uniref:ATP/GTP-binding protein n=1 Tax=Streptomyces triticagri TaxID=2293568 RepID=A0A372LZ38_9ACTN|nr:ATP/GTP-binding protein [Streptomyces triticagri]RFU83307.1 ATP/GTP-binding protein [Streptomyces triticagri]